MLGGFRFRGKERGEASPNKQTLLENNIPKPVSLLYLFVCSRLIPAVNLFSVCHSSEHRNTNHEHYELPVVFFLFGFFFCKSSSFEEPP